MSSLSNKLEATAAAISNTNNPNLVVTSPFKNVLATTQKKKFCSNYFSNPNPNFNLNHSINTFVL